MPTKTVAAKKPAAKPKSATSRAKSEKVAEKAPVRAKKTMTSKEKAIAGASDFLALLAEIKAEKSLKQKPYELLYIVPARYTEEELAPVCKKVSDLLKEFGASEISEELLGKKKLAYEIQHIAHGYYVLLRLKMPSVNLVPLNVRLQQMPEVLRHLFVQVTPDQYTPKHTSTRNPQADEIAPMIGEDIVEEKATRRGKKAVDEEIAEVE